jgi:hypothetical protein
VRDGLTGLEITGHDNVIFTCTDPRAAVIHAIDCLKERWGGILLNVSSLAPSSFDCSSLSLNELGEKGSILAVRDSAMDDFMDDNGYALMEDGEGPVSFLYSKRGPIIVELSQVKELKREDSGVYPDDLYDARLSDGINPPHPYFAALCSSFLFEVTVVTPDCSTDDPFSSWILHTVKLGLLSR